jgi:hypothetical protein
MNPSGIRVIIDVEFLDTIKKLSTWNSSTIQVVVDPEYLNAIK